ncbi:thiamine pyrophosphate-dependent enzyme [Clostridium sp.]|uniref:thiamine pyrophosphate-dependent enzyme n=1 Tax=Clostridium sp. TaxID=1506 RepID=UPI002FDDCD45
MNRIEAIKYIINKHLDAAIIFSNGLTSREASYITDRRGNFYMLHAMGEALSVGIGLKSFRKDLEVVVVEGDGNAIMGLSSITNLPIEGLYYYILDNEVYETTGSQATPRLNLDNSICNIIKISKGSIGAPNPPSPDIIIGNFKGWINGLTKEG